MMAKSGRSRQREERRQTGAQPRAAKRAVLVQERAKRAAGAQLLRDVLVVGGAILVVMAGLWVGLGTWPPMVVVESGSMMHGRDSSVGVIDTGDLTLVKSVTTRSDVRTWVSAIPRVDYTYTSQGGSVQEGTKTTGDGYSTYSNYGDVIIYRKNNMGGTPVIHRALLWVEPTSDPQCLESGAADLPELDLTCITTITFHKATQVHSDIRIDVASVLARPGSGAGFITKGDNNNNQVPALSDQQSLFDDHQQHLLPVRPSWIVGRAVGELPAFGLLRLFVTGQLGSAGAPPSSQRFLAITIVLLVGVPLAVDIYSGRRARKKLEQVRAPRRKPAKGADDAEE